VAAAADLAERDARGSARHLTFGAQRGWWPARRAAVTQVDPADQASLPTSAGARRRCGSH
jgi:hypothetical protein